MYSVDLFSMKSKEQQIQDFTNLLSKIDNPSNIRALYSAVLSVYEVQEEKKKIIPIRPEKKWKHT